MASQLTIPASVPGRFGPYGGRYVPETLMVPLLELERVYEQAKSDATFQAKFNDLLKNFAGRPTPLQFAKRLTKHLGGPRIYLKREDLLHTGAHKINNAIGQGLLAVQMKTPRISASNVSSIWAPRTWIVRPSTSPACACSARKSSASIPAVARSRTPSTKTCATGSPMFAPRTTFSAPLSARIRIRRWSAIFTPALAAKPARKFSLRKSAYPRIFSLA